MVGTSDKYADKAARWSDEQYADADAYLGHRAELVRRLGPELQRNDTVLDFACGDGGLAAHLLPHGLRYLGVDGSAEMVDAARARGLQAAQGDLNSYEPPAPVAATTVFRALYYAADREAFFRRVAAFTERKLVFDLNPRQFPLRTIRAELAAAGFTQLALRPFLVPQNVALPGLLRRLAIAAEPTPLAALALRFRFTYVLAASRSAP
ncbi:MAG: Methionine biosynthesis protein MetW [Gaiellaceae bacterium]|nr:Methionine biosynthesis protein MetW [Gaiellaceae bacterium]